MRTSFNTVDVRGLRLAAAEAKVDQFIKAGIPQNRKVVYILHGHGTGAYATRGFGLVGWLAGGCGRVSLTTSPTPTNE